MTRILHRIHLRPFVGRYRIGQEDGHCYFVGEIDAHTIARLYQGKDGLLIPQQILDHEAVKKIEGNFFCSIFQIDDGSFHTLESAKAVLVEHNKKPATIQQLVTAGYVAGADVFAIDTALMVGSSLCVPRIALTEKGVSVELYPTGMTFPPGTNFLVCD